MAIAFNRRLLATGFLAAATLASRLLASNPASAQEAAPRPAPPDYGLYTCISGYVWRNARPGDAVCVTPAMRDQITFENTISPAPDPHGIYGPHTCISGFVWREAFSGDTICVRPAVRAQVLADNAARCQRWYHRHMIAECRRQP